ncbi:hypothetical protein OSTOST_17490, partial [Ostertagia ostertagi]
MIELGGWVLRNGDVEEAGIKMGSHAVDLMPTVPLFPSVHTSYAFYKLTFTAWCNSHLRKAGTSIELIEEDFRN